MNVHPQKAEVRFADGRAVADAVYRVIADEVANAFGLPHAGFSRGRAQHALFDAPKPPPGDAWTWSTGAGVPTPRLRPRWPRRSCPPDEPLFASPRRRSARARSEPVPYPTAAELLATDRQPVFGALRFIAQVRSTFLICEGEDGIYLLDQHAAAERVTFHRLKTGYDAKSVASQKLLFPVVVAVTPLEAALVEQAQDPIAQLGMEVRVAGSAEVAVHAVPRLLGQMSPERLVRDLLDELGHGGERAFSGAIDLAIATMACHGSVRAGDVMPPDEARALLASLDEVDFAGHCPHGRPVVMRIGWNELESRVGRR